MKSVLLRICTQIILFVFLFHHLTVYAQVFINEFQIEPTPQVVELFNNGDSLIDISHWYIDDSGGATFFTIPSSTLIYPHACVSFTGDFNFNRTSADTVRLFNSLAPPTSSSAILLDSFSYKSSSGSAVNFQRIPDATQIWATAPATINLSNLTGESCLVLPTLTPTTVPSPTPFPTQTLVPTSTPTPQPPTDIPPIPTMTPTPTTTPTDSLNPTPTLTPTRENLISPTPTPTNLPTSTPTPIPITHIYISEIYPNPKNGETEWVELYNDNAFEVVLTNWKIDDEETTGSTPKTFTLTLPRYGFAVFELSASVFNNSGDSVRLLDSTNNVVESTEYPSIEPGYSYGRADFLTPAFCVQEPSPQLSNNMCYIPVITLTPSPTQTPTPSTPTTSPTQTPTSSITPMPTYTPTSTPHINYIYITELLPNPTNSENEWVELYNDNGFDVDITDWYIDDVADSGSSPKKFTINIKAYSYGSIVLPSPMFNNDSDDVRLLNSDKNLIDQISYSEIRSGYSINRNSIENDYVCFADPSIDSGNNECIALITPTPTQSPTPKPSATPKAPTATPVKRTTPPSLQIAPSNTPIVTIQRFHKPDTLHEVKNISKETNGSAHDDLRKNKESNISHSKTIRNLSLTSIIASIVTICITIIRIRF